MALTDPWVIQTSAADNNWRQVAWSPELSLFCAVADTGTGNRVMTSPDGIAWTTRTSAADNDWVSVAWSPELSLFCAVAYSGVGNRVMTSPDGIAWTTRTSAVDNGWISVVWSPELSLFCAVAFSGTGDRVMTSPDGITWTTRTSAADNDWIGATWSPELSLFCAVASTGTGNRVMTSPDGIAWTTRTSSVDNEWRQVAWSPELSLFCAVARSGTGNRVMTSPDGIAWTTRTSAADNKWVSVIWSPELSLFCAVAFSGVGNRVMTSPDGIAWTTRTSAADNSWRSSAWSPELYRFCAVAKSGVGNRVMTWDFPVPVLGSLTASIQSSVYASGVLSASIQNVVVPGVGVVSADVESLLYVTGAASAVIESNVVHALDTSKVSIQNDVVAGIGLVKAVLTQETYATGVSGLTIENDIVVDILPILTNITSALYGAAKLTTTITSEVYLEGITSFGFSQTLVSTAEPLTLSVRQGVFALGTAKVSLQQDNTESTYTLSVSIKTEITETFALKLGAYQSVYETTSGAETSPAGTVIPAGLVNPVSSPSFWSTRIMLGGVDVSSTLTGTISVDNEEEAAAVCQFTLKPTFGLVDLTQWVGAAVEVFYIKTDSAKAILGEFLLFNGFVDVPTYNPQSRLTTFTCTDELQKAFESMTALQIAALVGGFWSADVFDEAADKWTHAQDRLSTIPYSMNYNVNRVVVKTPWAAKETPDFTLNEAVVHDLSLSVELGNSRGIVNQVDIRLSYQYDTFQEVSKSYSWTMKPEAPTAAGVYGINPVTASMVLSAASSSGWAFSSEPFFTPWPPSGWYDGYALINTDVEMVVSTSFKVSRRYNQYVAEVTTHSLKASKSIESLGKLLVAEEYAFTAEYADEVSDFEETAELQGDYTAVLNTYFSGEVVDNVPVNPSFIGTVDVPFSYPVYKNTYPSEQVGEVKVFDLTSFITEYTRADLEATVEVVQNLHKTSILKSHRGNTVGASCLLEPTITREHTVKIDTAAVVAKGKVRQITHVMDIDAGSAISNIVLGVSRSTAVGISDTETPLDGSLEEAALNASGGGLHAPLSLGNWVQADQNSQRTGAGMEASYGSTAFLVPLPGVSQQNVDEVTVETEKEFIIDVPNEELTLNA